jgi:thioredoxin 1
MSVNVKDILDKDFENEVLKSNVPVVVDFWAPWCGPCKSIAPLLEELATEYAGKVKFAKMNVDDNREAPAKFNVRGIPNLVLIKDGEMKDQIVGAVAKQAIKDAIDQLI